MGNKRWRVLVALLAGLSLIAAACGDDDDDATGGTGTEPAVDEAQTLPVQVDGKPDEIGMSFLAYFPNELQARPGDTVDFTSVFTGEPHTVTFGGLIDDTLEMAEEAGFLGPEEPEGPPPPELEAQFEKVPFMFPDEPGQPLNQGAAQPCFVETEDPPIEEACSDDQQEQPAFDGTYNFYNSGFLPDEEVFSVEIAEDAAAGDYTFICLIHGPDMTGTLTVVDAGAEVPSADEVEQEGEAALEAAIGSLRTTARDARTATDPEAAPAGVEPEEEGELIGFVNAFPEELSVAEGGTVTWNVAGFHTISFNAPEDATPVLIVDADGTVRENEKVFAPEGWPGQERPEGPPPGEGEDEGPPGEGPPGEDEGPPEPVAIDAGEWDGDGFHNSGPIEGFGPVTYSLTFTTAGTYEYVCLIHTDMEGTIKVG